MKGLLIAATLMSLVACTTETEEVMPTVKLGEGFDLKINQSMVYTDSKGTINGKLLKIEDSRCPEDVQCIRAGEVIVTFDLQVGDEAFKDVKVCLQCEKSMGIGEKAEIKAKSRGVVVTLKDVTPYPKSNTNPEKIAKLMIESM